MTAPTPEEMAREIARKHLKPVPGTQALMIVVADDDAIAADIAQAIGQAREDGAREVRASREELRRLLTKAVARAKEWKEAAIRCGCCEACQGYGTSNNQPEGCSDCWGTGWREGDPYARAEAAEARAEAAERLARERDAAATRADKVFARAEAAEADRDALLLALGLKPGPLTDETHRAVVLTHARTLGPDKVKATRQAVEECRARHAAEQRERGLREALGAAADTLEVAACILRNNKCQLSSVMVLDGARAARAALTDTRHPETAQAGEVSGG